MNDERLEARLFDLGARLAAPGGVDVAQRVRRRLEDSPRPRIAILARPRRVVLLAAVIVVIAAGGAFAGFAIRGILITVDGTPSPTSQTGASLRLGQPTTLERARERAGFPILVPERLGAPDEVWIDERAPSTPVTLLYRPGRGLPPSPVSDVSVVLTQFRAGIGEVVFGKSVPSPEDVRRVTVDGRPGYWIRGDHLVSYIAPDGSTFGDTGRLSAGTLLWERDGVTLRLESSLPLSRALQIAGSLH